MSFGKFKDNEKKDGEKTEKESARVTPLVPPTSAATQTAAYLGQGSKVKGTLVFDGPVEIDGEIDGEINAKQTLTIGESATVKAKVLGAEIIVRGTVEGDIIASKRLSLRKPARVIGNITSPAMSIEEGVVFEGTCSMGEARASVKSSAA